MVAGVPRRDKVRKGFKSPDGLALLSTVTAAAKKDNDARAADPWTSGGAKANQYREPMASVKVIKKGTYRPGTREI